MIETFVSFVPRHGKLGFGEAASRIYSFFLRVSHNYSNGKFWPFTFFLPETKPEHLKHNLN